MIRTLNLVLIATSILVVTGVYGLKYAVEGVAGQRSALERTIEAQEAELSLLKAEWALLNQPSHLAPVVARHAEVLDLAPLSQRQFGEISALPMRQAAPDSEAMDALFAALAAGIDPADHNLMERF